MLKKALYWVDLINKTLPMYKLTYLARGCPKKIDKLWLGWINAVSGDLEICFTVFTVFVFALVSLLSKRALMLEKIL